VVSTTAAVLGVLFVPAPTFAAGATGDHYAAPNHKISHSTSTNWSGYAVSGLGACTSVSSSGRG
jgi:hypothetical protein